MSPKQASRAGLPWQLQIRRACIALLGRTAQRALIRWHVLKYGIVATVFWTAAILGATWLIHFGLEPLVWFLVVVWGLASFPALHLQVLLILDVINYAVGNRVVFFPRLAARRVNGEREWLRSAPWVVRVIIGVLRLTHITSPLSSLSLWCFIVLARVPKRAYATAYVDAHEGIPMLARKVRHGLVLSTLEPRNSLDKDDEGRRTILRALDVVLRDLKRSDPRYGRHGSSGGTLATI